MHRPWGRRDRVALYDREAIRRGTRGPEHRTPVPARPGMPWC